jgi:hypothetical protein
MTAISIDPRLWPRLHPLLIAHDVGGSRDRSTAVVGGYCWLWRRQMGRDQDPRGSALPASHRHRGKEILALCGERRGP